MVYNQVPELYNQVPENKSGNVHDFTMNRKCRKRKRLQKYDTEKTSRVLSQIVPSFWKENCAPAVQAIVIYTYILFKILGCYVQQNILSSTGDMGHITELQSIPSWVTTIQNA